MRRIFAPIPNILTVLIFVSFTLVALAAVAYQVLILILEREEIEDENEWIYYDIINGFTIEYDGDRWRILEVEKNGFMSIAFKPFEPLHSNTTVESLVNGYYYPPAALTVNIQNLTSNQNATLEDLMKIDVDILKNNSYAILLTNNTANLSGNPAYELVATNSSDGNFRTMQISTFKNDKLYTVIYEASIEAYSKFLPSAMQIIDSLTIYLLGVLR